MDLSIIYYKYLDYGPKAAKQFYGPSVGASWEDERKDGKSSTLD